MIKILIDFISGMVLPTIKFDGEHRCYASKSLGWTKTACYLLSILMLMGMFASCGGQRDILTQTYPYPHGIASKLGQMKYPKAVIPESIRQEAEKALSYYPELRNTPIEFKFNDMVRKNFMQAQPTWASIFKSRYKRSYIILISKEFKVEDKVFSLDVVPDDVLVGWLGHELGHVMDYRDRSSFGMIWFGAKYLFSSRHIQEVERAADDYAVKHGMGEYILKTKNFILDNASLSDTYKARMRRFYLSPEEILELINEYEETGKEPDLEELEERP